MPLIILPSAKWILLLSPYACVPSRVKIFKISSDMNINIQQLIDELLGDLRAGANAENLFFSEKFPQEAFFLGLWQAARDGDALAAGALAPLAPGGWVSSSLSQAAMKGALPAFAAILDSGAHPNRPDEVLDACAAYNACEAIALLDNRFKFSTGSWNGALREAAKKGSLEALSLALARGADPDGLGRLGMSAAMLAAANHNRNIIDILAPISNLSLTDCFGRTASMLAREKNEYEMAGYMDSAHQAKILETAARSPDRTPSRRARI